MLIEVPDQYVWTKPFLSEADMAEKTMSMKRFHAWYLKACSLGLTHVLARVPPECFQLGDQVVFIEFKLMWEFFHLQKLDNELLRLLCLYVPSTYYYVQSIYRSMILVANLCGNLQDAISRRVKDTR